jgi:hypothetical protein
MTKICDIPRIYRLVKIESNVLHPRHASGLCKKLKLKYYTCLKKDTGMPSVTLGPGAQY